MASLRDRLHNLPSVNTVLTMPWVQQAQAQVQRLVGTAPATIDVSKTDALNVTQATEAQIRSVASSIPSIAGNAGRPPIGGPSSHRPETTHSVPFGGTRRA